MSISADGYVAGPGQCEEQPLGIGGRELHDWHLGPTKNHPVNRQVVSDMMDGMGATIMGRNMFGPIRGEWEDSDWKGWWGDVPPYHCPVFVLTHYPHHPIDLQINPVILGSGERLFDGFEAGKPALELVRVLGAPGVAHLRYRVVR